MADTKEQASWDGRIPVQQRDTRTQTIRGQESSAEGHGAVDSNQPGFGHVRTCGIRGMYFSVYYLETMGAVHDVLFLLGWMRR